MKWLGGLEQQVKKIRQLKRTISRKQSKLTELEKENQDLLQKLEALKAIETSIN
ncbi:hypothetical protein [Bathymodiolus platifrons methanotrophic gill symbiont]|uniref:hypothetical protein n=1 Tax=Bathymodiolus platifrons methanotrophic gill symbiont TaxID=113268 RepID=UPI001C8DA254|nr:hypothetical protein [Bathymodiolus platifrons methanotrophic gill symbiont]